MHVAVVGAGVFGIWTAFHLHAAGARVTLVDAYGSGNSRSSSGDESRILRCGYGPDEIYSQMARRSLALWRAIAERAGAPIWHACGVLWLAGDDDPYTIATRQTLEAGGYPLQVLDAPALQARYPHLAAADVRTALFEPECGILMARRAVQLMALELSRGGVRVIRGRVAPAAAGLASALGSAARQPLGAIELFDGRRVAAERFVFACGAWLPLLFPALLGGRIRPTRQVVVYFGTPAGDDRFGPAQTPAWIDFPAGLYGVPDLEARGVKVGIDEHGPPIDPDTDDRTPDSASIVKARTWLARRFPAMADAPVVETRVCQYENTSTGDFLIDRHPDHANVWIAGGGSGHGFKHGPAVGELVARLVTTDAATHPRFALTGKTTETRRTIY